MNMALRCYPARGIFAQPKSSTRLYRIDKATLGEQLQVGAMRSQKLSILTPQDIELELRS